MKRIPAILGILIFCLVSCKKQTGIGPSVTDKSSISEYSPLVLSVKEEFFVRFSKKYIIEDEIKSEVSSDLISIEPQNAYKAIWQDRRTIICIPKDQWSHETNYKVFVDTDKMFESGKRSMITFQTGALSSSLNAGPMQFSTSGVSTDIEVHGTVSMSDYADPKIVEQSVSYNQNDNKGLSIEWEHSATNFNHNFIIKGIKRFEEGSELIIKNNEVKPMSKIYNEETIIVIPAKQKFSFISSKLPSESSKYFELAFSDPVDKSQNLDGLIRIKDFPTKFKFDIDRNIIKVYPTPFPSKNVSLIISEGIKSTEGKKLATEHRSNISIVPAKPEVRFASTGNILPHVGSSILAFEAMALSAVDVEIFKNHENNIQEFFQSYSLEGAYGNRTIGEVVHSEKIDLRNISSEVSDGGWRRYALNLDYFRDADPAAIYEVRLGFKKEYSSYDQCENKIDPNLITYNDQDADMFSQYPQYPGMEWDHYNDPCFPAYYTGDNFVRKNILVSNLGLVAKGTTGKGINIYASDLRSAQPINGVSLSLYSVSKQLIATVQTNSQGMAFYKDADEVFFVYGQNNREYSYITINNNRRLETSQFDVSGVSYDKGINGYFYGERGVWRPGDTIFLSLMLEDREGLLPADHPVKLMVYNARGILHSSTTKLDNVDGLYVFPIETSHTDPTGNWRVEAKVGNHTFRKKLKVETIKPNRLKISHDKANEKLYDLAKDKVTISSKWLHGTPASGLEAKVEANLVSINPEFENYNEYEFADPARKINISNIVVYEENLDENGEGSFDFQFDQGEMFPGNIKANLTTRVFEKSGNYSNYYSSNILYPFKAYAGLKLPKSRWGRNYISSTTGTKVEFVSVDSKGKPKSNRKLKVGIYESRWSWWYNRSDRNIYKYNSNNHFGALDTFTVVTNAQGVAAYDTDFGDIYGNYMIRVCDEVSGHCSGEFFYTGDWGGSAEEDNSMTKLNVTSNADNYKVGESVKVNFPSSEGANILVTIESVNGVLQSEWIPSQGDKTEYSFTASEEMLPNVYVNVNMIQTWERENDLPIRMYGIIPIEIKDPNSELNPEIQCTNVFAPNTKISVNVSEKNGKGMAYTIAMVDEGLLDLTNFTKPDPHGHFYAKQALGVRTWDMYDDVINKNGGDIEKIISVGGDGELVEGASKANANRFIPVVHFDGPFYLENGESKKHDIEIPNYMGSVKLVVVAKNGGSYGSEEKAVPVKKELMLLSTFPRVLTLGDQVSIPVNTFWTEDYKTSVSLSMETNEMVVPVRSSSKTNFDKAGDKISNLVATVGDKEGIAEFKITGTAGKFSSFDEVEIDVRNPNPIETKVSDFTLKSGETLSEVVKRFGLEGNQAAKLEISRLPSLNLEKRLNYLIRYPYGCLEQTVSSVFPQLYLSDLTQMPEIKKKEIDRNIAVGIKKLRSYQTTGRFNYWRGGSYYHNWSDIYAAHFLHEASQKGYHVGSNVLKNWIEYHYEIASQFDNRNAKQYAFDEQAYRLYVLAITGNANTGAMNRMRAVENMTDRAKYLLAAAYGRLGQAAVGKRILADVSTEIKDVEYYYNVFSSTLRDQSIAAIALTELDLQGSTISIISSMAKKLSSSNWFSTHSIAFALMSVAKVANVSEKDKMNYNVTLNNASARSIESEQVIDSYDLALVDQSSFSVTNNGDALIYVSVMNSGKERPTIIEKRNDNLNINVAYYDEDGGVIDYKNIVQGTDFKAIVNISNPGTVSNVIEDLALSQIFPAGWEIRSGGLSNEQTNEKYQYQEVRDDRVNTFFQINRRKGVSFEVKLNAAYVGDYYLPPTTCGSMYNNRIYASTASDRVKVIER